MFFVIYTLCWLGIWIVSCLFSFFLGRLPIINSSGLPWILHRSYEPDTASRASTLASHTSSQASDISPNTPPGCNISPESH
jgi:hypothetical protein